MSVSDKVMMSLLAMDVYNRGDDPGVLGLSTNNGTQIGTATVSSFLTDIPSSFHAISYTWNGKSVISYQGTDDIPGGDLLHGWTLGGGFDSASQAQTALAFFDAVDATNGDKEIVTTGHSLGGGLSGFVSLSKSVTGFGFDYMSFVMAAALQSYSDYNAQNPNTPLSEQSLSEIWSAVPSVSNFTGYNMQGEVLLAERSIAYALDTINFLTRNLWLGNESDYKQYLFAYLTSAHATLIGNTSTVDNEGVLSNPVNLHSQALMTIYQFAEQEESAGHLDTAWRDVAPELGAALFDSTIATRLGQIQDETGGSDPASQMLTKIAYSVLDEGERPFGDTGVRALLNDAAQLGNMTDNHGISDPSIRQSVSNIVVSYAGGLAVSGFMAEWYPDAVSGVISAFPNGIKLHLNDDAWHQGGNFLQEEPITDLIGALFRNATSDTVSYAEQAFFSAIDLSIITQYPGQITAAFFSSGTSVVNATDIGSILAYGSDAADTYRTGSASSLIIAAGGNDVVELGNASNIISLGSGNDSVVWSGGSSFIAGGTGTDSLKFSTFRPQTSFLKTAEDTYTVTAGQDVLQMHSLEQFEFSNSVDKVILDTLVSSQIGTRLLFKLAGGNDEFIAAGHNIGIDVIGGSGANILIGGSGNDTIHSGKEGGGGVFTSQFGGLGNNLIKEGGFEFGNDQPWYGNWGYLEDFNTYWAVYDYDNSYDPAALRDSWIGTTEGNNSVWLTRNTVLAQSVDTELGKNYQFSIEAWGHANGMYGYQPSYHTNTIIVSVNGVEMESFDVMPMHWQGFTFEFTGSGVDTISIRSASLDETVPYVGIDDISVQEVGTIWNHVAGNAGNDIIKLDNSMSDFVLFGRGDDQDTIEFYDTSHDKLIIDSRLTGSFSGLLEFAEVLEDGFIFDFEQGDSLTFKGTSLGDIIASNFVFADLGSSQVKADLSNNWGEWLI